MSCLFIFIKNKFSSLYIHNPLSKQPLNIFVWELKTALFQIVCICVYLLTRIASCISVPGVVIRWIYNTLCRHFNKVYSIERVYRSVSWWVSPYSFNYKLNPFMLGHSDQRVRMVYSSATDISIVCVPLFSILSGPQFSDIFW